jgi:phosphoserine phosphatase
MTIHRLKLSQLAFIFLCVLVALVNSTASVAEALPEPLASWNDGPAKAALVDFVKRSTTEGSPDLVPIDQRIAVFDNDGTLWAEQPMYVQGIFALGRVKAVADKHPEWASEEPFRSVIAGDMKSVAHSGEEGLLRIVMATHSGMTTDEFSSIVGQWIATARHPTKDRLYTELVYQPMLEALAFLRANGFKTYIVSGGGADFMRVFAREVYGVPPEQVIGSTVATRFELKDGVATLVRLPKLDFLDDKEGKPMSIHKFIGQRPLICFGNSDGDLQMLQYTTTGPRPGIGFIVRHDDAEREWAYDRTSHVGKLDRALDEAPTAGWHVVSMRSDWKFVFPAEKAKSP